MLEILRRSPALQIGAGKAITLRNVRLPAKSLSLSAEAVVENGSEKPVALAFGPENGAINETIVFEAAREAHSKSHTHL
jgi:adenine-specific DNA-methyltransferase